MFCNIDAKRKAELIWMFAHTNCKRVGVKMLLKLHAIKDYFLMDEMVYERTEIGSALLPRCTNKLTQSNIIE